MPVFIRKNVRFTPPSINKISDEEDDDYLQDPDQMRDVLPQPYRMITKVLDALLFDVWEIIEEKEKKRLELERKVRPPRYDKPIKMQEHCQATALANTADGSYIFVGLPNGLAAVSTHDQQTVCRWEETGAEIIRIQACNLSPSSYLLVTLDDMAIARLFLFASNFIFFVKTLNPSETVPKLLAHTALASLEGDYLGIIFEVAGSPKDVWLEVHRLPRDSWIKELEAAEMLLNRQREEENVAMSPAETASSPRAEEAKKFEAPKNRPGRSSKKSNIPDKLEPPGSNSPSFKTLDKVPAKFSGPNLGLKIKPPVPFGAASSSTPHLTGQKAESGEVLGTGQAHIMSAAHLHARDTMFQDLHAGLIKYLPEEDERTQQSVLGATFHFLNLGRIPVVGMDNAVQKDEEEREASPKDKKSKADLKKKVQDRPSAIAVWWSGTSHLLQFSLLKTAKDLEHKPDVVWPFSCTITASAISTCTSYIAIGLENGNVVMWDRYLGVQCGVVSMSVSSPVQRLSFIDPSIYPCSQPRCPPYLQRNATFLAAQCQDATQYLYDIGHMTHDRPFCIEKMPETDDEVQTLLECVPDLPELAVVVQKNGRLYLKDIQTGVKVCELALPSTHYLASPWEPIIAFGVRGQLLFVKGNGVEIDESGESNDTSGLFIYTLRSFPTLDKYWSRTRSQGNLVGHPSIEHRLDALMKERIEQQALRKQRLQYRWNLLHSDLDIIQGAQETTVSPVTSRLMV